ncbi:hypothetical protein P389DRAFT_71712 [Cystobasidium minutum MCA 4210]|uniref:uncharacterized protein n=1 Tax=Cystobasidium minutum MCA 4210 TaxID=1397322 RepID=UPI0034CDA8B8|eukprot:jgi/Rhomi1/71712/CE71711_673
MPDMYNLPATLDLSRLLIFHSVLGCVTAVSFGAPSYNLPIALFGLFIVDKSSNEGLRQFGALHALSLALDLIWLLTGHHETSKFITFLILINLFAKPVTLLAVTSTFKAQGVSTMGPMGISGFDHHQGTTVWSADDNSAPAPQYQQSSPYQSGLDEEAEDLSPPPRSGGHAKKGSSSSGGYHTIA